MKLGIILQSNNPEHAWNAFRLGITALKAGNQAEVFLMSEGSDIEVVEWCSYCTEQDVLTDVLGVVLGEVIFLNDETWGAHEAHECTP